MFWFSCEAEGWQHHESTEWGACTRYVEVFDDQYAGRTIEVYKNGNILKYDRDYQSDSFGRLIGLRFSLKRKWRKNFRRVDLITQDEFEGLWQRHERNATLPD